MEKGNKRRGKIDESQFTAHTLPQIEKLAPRFHVCKMTYTIFRGKRIPPTQLRRSSLNRGRDCSLV